MAWRCLACKLYLEDLREASCSSMCTEGGYKRQPWRVELKLQDWSWGYGLIAGEVGGEVTSRRATKNRRSAWEKRRKPSGNVHEGKENHAGGPHKEGGSIGELDPRAGTGPAWKSRLWACVGPT